VDASRDLVLVAVRGMAAAVLLGTAVVLFALWGVGVLVAGAAPSDGPVGRGSALALLLGGTALALLASTGVAWTCLSPIDSYYRRGGLALVCAFATFVMAVLAAPLHHFFGQGALLGAGAGALAGGLLLLRLSSTDRHGRT
jgi:ABC-type transport system involved in multi-copper enzyme maturation permease subunit